jgi:UDP-MurNAc hydroxylase
VRMTSIGHAGILVETADGRTITCDPWFWPQYLGAWFVFPRNDRLPTELMGRITAPDYLYVSHLHADHLDARFLAESFDHSTPVLVPDFPNRDFVDAVRRAGFTTLIETEDGKPVDLGGGLAVTIHVEAALSDGPQGDSALVVDDGVHRMLDLNDCRLAELDSVLRDGPIDALWLQFSGAIWYPLVYEHSPEDMARLVAAKVESQFARAERYVRDVGARLVVPSAGPPCFLDPDLWAANDLPGNPPSIFPDAPRFAERLAAQGIASAVVAPGATIELAPDGAISVEHLTDPSPIFADKEAYLRAYQADWMPWIEAEHARWGHDHPNLLWTIRDRFEPLLAMAPNLRKAIGAGIVLRLTSATDPLDVFIDVARGEVRAWQGEPYGFRFTVERRLVETVIAEGAIDWSNSLFLSLRFSAWRVGGYNEAVYSFFKSLSPERMRRAESEIDAEAAVAASPDEVLIGEFLVERYCPHRKADLAAFGQLGADGCTLTCQLHGWQFDLRDGRCLTSDDRTIRSRRAEEHASRAHGRGRP